MIDRSTPDLGDLFQDIILEHYKRPRNKGSLDDFTVDVTMNNPTCGDAVHLYLKVTDGVVEDVALHLSVIDLHDDSDTQRAPGIGRPTGGRALQGDDARRRGCRGQQGLEGRPGTPGGQPLSHKGEVCPVGLERL